MSNALASAEYFIALDLYKKEVAESFKVGKLTTTDRDTMLQKADGMAASELKLATNELRNSYRI